MSGELVNRYRDYVKMRVQIDIRNSKEVGVFDMLRDPVGVEFLISEMIEEVLRSKSDEFIIENEYAVGIVTDDVKDKLRDLVAEKAR